MAVITNKIKIIQEEKKLSLKQLAELIGYPHGGLSNMINAKTPFTKPIIKKLLPILEVSKEEFESWIVADKYSKEIIKRAIQVKKDFPYKRKSILTIKIDTLLEERGLSRRAFAKQIGYEQSSFNQMLTGKRNMSDSVREKVSVAFEISQEEILSWIVADRHGLAVLEGALS